MSLAATEAVFLSKGTPRQAARVQVAENAEVELRQWYRWEYYVTPTLAAMVPASLWQELVDLVFSVRDRFRVTYVELQADGTLVVEGQALHASPILLLSPLGILAIGAVGGVIVSIIGYFTLQRVEKFVDDPLGVNPDGGASGIWNVLSGMGLAVVIAVGLFLYFFWAPPRRS